MVVGRPTSGAWWIFRPGAPDYLRKPFIAVFTSDGTYLTPGDEQEQRLDDHTVILAEIPEPEVPR